MGRFQPKKQKKNSIYRISIQYRVERKNTIERKSLAAL